MTHLDRLLAKQSPMTVPASTLISDAGTTSLPGLGDGEGPEVRQNLSFTVFGIPVPQGSHRGFVVNGRAVITQDNARTRPWRQDMTQAALEALGGRPAMVGPVHVIAQFVMPRPKAHYGTGRNAGQLRENAPTYPAGKPDVDKLARNLLDSLTAAQVVRDDSQVVHLCAYKVYASPAEKPGLHVYVSAVPR